MRYLRWTPSLGSTSYEEVAKVLDEVLAGRTGTHLSCFHDLSELPQTEVRRVVTTGGHYAFLKSRRAVTSAAPIVSSLI